MTMACPGSSKKNFQLLKSPFELPMKLPVTFRK
ncbi:unnamed protein product [Gulo gulo]|uniref:Uncharacterized protein n=1 Tax=Gulo gulo TaxID=48420 RepID=A0A9X9LT40_GULGU|nr:unnamed protein product [Gulo gulo]